MTWDYAELSKAAKKAGGPEQLMDLLIESGKDQGQREMLPAVGIAFTLGALAYAGISKFVKVSKKKNKIPPEEVESAKAELIKGIEEYDARQSEKAVDGAIEEGEKYHE